MPRSRQPIQNELNGTFGIFCLTHFFYTLLYILWFLVRCFYGFCLCLYVFLMLLKILFKKSPVWTLKRERWHIEMDGGSRKELGGVEGRETVIRIYYMKILS